MKHLSRKITLLTITALAFAEVVHAQGTILWTDNGENNLWSNALNWQGENIPDTNSETAQFNLTADRSIDVDGAFTVNKVLDGFGGEGVTTTLYGAGTLTIDVNSSASTAIGVDGATGNSGGILLFNGNVVINNTGQDAAGDVTIIRNTNSAGNIVRFDTGSVLTLQTRARTNATATAPGSKIEFNGTFAASAEDLQIASNVSFGEGHDSSAFAQDVVLLGNALLTVDGGTVLSTGQKFQVNGNAELVLNAADAVNGANIVVGGANNLLLDVNANQGSLGFINVANGVLTIDVDAAVTDLSFGSGYSVQWGAGTVTLTGFKEGTIRFGTDATGLTREQLDVINGGIYSLTSDGYLTEESISYWAGFEIDEAGYVLLAPWIELHAYAASAPYLWLVGGGWVYMEEVVGINGFGWSYSYELPTLQIYRTDESGFGYSFALNRWVYSQDEVAGEPAGWFYVL